MKLNVAAKIAAGFGLTLLVFLFVGLASYRALSDVVEAADARKESYDLLDQLDRIEPLLAQLELGTRSHFLTGEAAYLEQAQIAADKLPTVLQRVRRLQADDPQQLDLLDRLEPLVRNRIQNANDVAADYRQEGQAAAVRRIRTGQGPALSTEIVRLLDDMQKIERSLLGARSDAADATAGNARATMIWGTLAGLALALLAGILITRDISRPLRELTAVAQRIAGGDINVHVPAQGRVDEVGVLAHAFSQMTSYLRDMAGAATLMAAGDLRNPVAPKSPDDVLGQAFARMSTDLGEQIRQLVEAAGVLGVSANQIVVTTSQLAASASQSAAAVAETTATVDEVRQTAEIAAQKARHVSDTAQRAVQDTQDGRKSVQEMTAGMDRIRQQMDGIVAHMATLSERSQAIGQIIASVDDLAVQSNLLAVNAAIEAAKAGEHGKGFAVVAQEVKHLAAQSRQATSEVRTILSEIQAATGSAVTAIRHGGDAVEVGGRKAETARDAIDGLSARISESAQAATQIAASSQQQLVGMDQMASAMESIRQASSQNSDSARELEGAARNLNALGQQLQQTAGRYTLLTKHA